MTEYRIINGDCLVEMHNLPADSVDLIFADPPYWMRTTGKLRRVEGTEYDGCDDEWDNTFKTLQDYVQFTRAWLTEAKRILKPNGSLWVIGSMQCIYTIGNALQELGYWIINDVIWWKLNPTPNMMGTRLCNAHETLIWAVKNEKAKFTFHYRTAKELNREALSDTEYLSGVRKQLGSVWRFPVCSGSERIKTDNGAKLHSTQKPLTLLYRIVNICSNVGDLVLDPFSGTFTTGEAALMSGRRFIGIEKDPEYCRYGERRLMGTLPLLGAVEKAEYDVRPEKVSWKQLLEKGVFVPGETLYLKDGGGQVSLLPDGNVRMPDGMEENIHIAGARMSARKADRINGFNVWYVMRDGKLTSIDEMRNTYRNQLTTTK